MLTVVALCLLAIVNWAAFFTGHIQCGEAISFLGAAILERYSSEVECRNNLRIVVACIDTAVFHSSHFSGGSPRVLGVGRRHDTKPKDDA